MIARRLIALLALALGCGSQSVNGTLVVVEVRSDLAIPAQLDTLEILVHTASGGSASKRFPVGADSLPVTLGVVPEGKTSGNFTVTVIAYAAGKMTLMQVADAAFVPNEARKLELFLGASCLPVAPGCTGGQTCRGGACVGPGDGVSLSPYGADAGGGSLVEGGPVMIPDGSAPADVPLVDAPSIDAGDDMSSVPPDTGPPPDGAPPPCGKVGEACCTTGMVCNGAATCTANVCQCAAPATMCAGACVNPQSNPNHCRSCNHSCQGGACVSGACSPVMVASAQDNPSYLTSDDTGLYWRRGPTTGGSIARMPKDGSAMPTDIVKMVDGIGAIASSGAKLAYFANRNIWSCDLPACVGPSRLSPAMPTMSLGTDIIDVHINLAKTKAFFTDQAKIYSVPLAVGPVTTHLTGNFPSVAMALDPQFMYYVSRDAMNQVSVEKLTINIPPARAPVVALGTSGSPRQLFVTTDRLLWVNTGSLGSIALDAASKVPPPAIFTGNITRAAVEGSTVFWGEFTSASAGRIFGCPTTGCRGVTTPLAATCGPTYITADATTVYWLCPGLGTLWKVAR